jgi:YVTN family beta-propeller protein
VATGCFPSTTGASPPRLIGASSRLFRHFSSELTANDFRTFAARPPDGLRAYVTNSGSNTVSVIGTAADAVVTTIGVGASPWAAAVTPDGRSLYVTMPGAGTVAVVSTATDTLVGTVGSLNRSTRAGRHP